MHTTLIVFSPMHPLVAGMAKAAKKGQPPPPPVKKKDAAGTKAGKADCAKNCKWCRESSNDVEWAREKEGKADGWECKKDRRYIKYRTKDMSKEERVRWVQMKQEEIKKQAKWEELMKGERQTYFDTIEKTGSRMVPHAQTVDGVEEQGQRAEEVNGIWWDEDLFRKHHDGNDPTPEQGTPMKLKGRAGFRCEDDGRPLPIGCKRLFNDDRSYAQRKTNYDDSTKYIHKDQGKQAFGRLGTKMKGSVGLLQSSDSNAQARVKIHDADSSDSDDDSDMNWDLGDDMFENLTVPSSSSDGVSTGRLEAGSTGEEPKEPRPQKPKAKQRAKANKVTKVADPPKESAEVPVTASATDQPPNVAEPPVPQGTDRKRKSCASGSVGEQGWRVNVKRIRKMQTGEEMVRKAKIFLENAGCNELFMSMTPGEMEKLCGTINSFLSDSDLMKFSEGKPDHVEQSMDLRDSLRLAQSKLVCTKAVVEKYGTKGVQARELMKAAAFAKEKGVPIADVVNLKVVELVLTSTFHDGDRNVIPEIRKLFTEAKEYDGFPTLRSLDPSVAANLLSDLAHEWFTKILYKAVPEEKQTFFDLCEVMKDAGAPIPCSGVGLGLGWDWGGVGIVVGGEKTLFDSLIDSFFSNHKVSASLEHRRTSKIENP